MYIFVVSAIFIAALAALHWQSKSRINGLETKNELAVSESQRLQNELISLNSERDRLQAAFKQADTQGDQALSELRQMKQRLAELEEGKEVQEDVYRILTLGLSGSGKSTLTRKWARPIENLEAIQPTTYCSVYKAPAAIAIDASGRIKIKYFEIWDYGGEFGPDVLRHMHTVENVKAVIVVADLGIDQGNNEAFAELDRISEAEEIQTKRIDDQLKRFSKDGLDWIFGAASMKDQLECAILFINKVDLLVNTPIRSVDEVARTCYRSLIRNFSDQIEGGIVICGSARTGQGTHELFAHLREALLDEHDHINAREISNMKNLA